MEYGLALSRTHNNLGNVLDDSSEARRHYERARIVAQALCNQHPDDLRCVERLMPPIGNLARLAKTEGD